MQIKMIAMDVDGTLVNSKRVITKATKEALLKAQKEGITLVIASGRPTTGLVDFVRELEMDKYGGYIVSYNGSQIIQCSDMKTLHHQPLEVGQIKEILHHLKQFDVFPMVDDGKTLYVDNPETYKLDYEVTGSKYELQVVDNLVEFINFTSSKVLVSGLPETLRACFQEMKEPFDKQLSIAFSADFYVEFTAQNVDKGNALDFLANHLGLTSKEVIAFGDGGNDLSMIQYAGIGVAMGNAIDHLKSHAQYVTLSNEEDGISFALAQWLTQ